MKVISPTRTFALTAALFWLAASSLPAREVPPPVKLDGAGTLQYVSDADGNRVPDFSHAGYGGGGVVWPRVAARVRVEPVEGEDGRRIQAAIDHVSALPADAQGLRGAVELAPGAFQIAGQLKIQQSGVVLRGAGAGEQGTVLVATGTDRRALIEVAGADRRLSLEGRYALASPYVPVGAHRIRLAGAPAWPAGTRVTVHRPGTAAWIASVGMDDAPGRQPYQWKQGSVDVRWDRRVVSVNGAEVVLDAPVTAALEERFGGGSVEAYRQEGYLYQVGVEHLRCVSDYDRSRPADEDHAWNAIDLHAVEDAWVANVTAVHFAGSAIQVGAKAARVTVQDCSSLAPVSELAGYRRLAFHSRGQQVLFLRCRAEFGGQDFTVGYLSAGPTVFLDCTARETRGFSGSIGSWSTGLLFDGVRVDGGSLRLDHLETWNQGVGWAAANSMLWACEASVIVCRSPPGAQNWAVASWGQYLGDGRWSMVSEFARPESLYRAQLAERCGPLAAAAALAARTYSPDTAVETVERAVTNLVARLQPKPRDPGRPLAVVQGWLTVGGTLATGTQTGGAWWLGRLEPGRASEAGPALTRFAPGRTGTGLTDELPAVAGAMVAKGQVAFRHHYGLWYDRRRIDHQMVRRPDANVYPPFFEQPFARSGVGTAWDGLSRYDLTRYNPWYFGRLNTFAEIARERGLILIHEMYFQHNILESGAHWVDSPWRPVNARQDTGFVEPPPFKGDTIQMAAAFYDVDHPVRREVHRNYIRHCLDALADQPNVLHTLTAENSGPLSFMQFWLDVIAAWKAETGRPVLVALSAPKDVQDAILADPVRAPLVDVIDLAYWFRTDRGELFAPEGGTRLAPRQHARLWKGGRPSAASLAAEVRELRRRFPAKAVISPLPEAEGWTWVAAGGSLASLPATIDPALRTALATMQPGPMGGLTDGHGQVFHVVSQPPLEVALATHAPGYRIRSIDRETGRVLSTENLTGGRAHRLERPGLYWISRHETP